MRLRCTCPRTDPTSLLVQVGAVEPGLTYSIERTCSTHGAVDEILATGKYTDRRGRVWARSPHHSELGEYWYMPVGQNHPGRTHHLAYLDEMRLLIERDQHRSTCPGLWDCRDHPVPTVTLSRMFKPRIDVNDFGAKITLTEAMDDARALAVGQ